MTTANILWTNTFEGAGYPAFDVAWPDFEFVDGNPTGWTTPVVDGHKNGISSRTLRAASTRPWRGRSMWYPGRADYKVDLAARWQNPAGAGGRVVGAIVLFVDYNNFIVARVASVVGGNPTLTLVLVEEGNETTLGSYSGAGVSTSDLAALCTWRVRVKANAGGTLSLKVYTSPNGIIGNGTLRIDVTIDQPPTVAGMWTAGVEIYGALGDEVYVKSLTCYDFADEWAPTTPPSATSGWQVELGTELYDLAQLEAMTPSITLNKVKQGYGMGGNTATLGVYGDFRIGDLVRPKQSVRVYYDGVVLFHGTISEADVSASVEEAQEFVCRDRLWASRTVNMEEEDGSGSHFFNVFDETSDDYDAERQGMSIGDLIRWLFDRYTDRAYGLRYYGACPTSGPAYVDEELQKLDGVFPDVTVKGSFLAAVQALLKNMPNFQVFVDPATGVWHFYDVTTLTGEVIAFGSEHATFSMRPDPDASITAIRLRGTKKPNADAVTLSLSDGSLIPAWTEDQENSHVPGKTKKKQVTITAVTAGTAFNVTILGKLYSRIDYIECAADTHDVQPGYWRGGAVSVQGFLRLVVDNTSVRFYLSPPNWMTPPAPGEKFGISLLHPQAVIELSGAGVGRGYFLSRPELICAAPGMYAQSFKNRGWCGKAFVASSLNDGNIYNQQYKYNLRGLTPTQQAQLGVCGPVVQLADAPLTPIGLVNFFDETHPPGLSPPLGPCTTNPKAAKQPRVDVQISVSKYETSVLSLRVPAVGWRGRGFSNDPSTWDGGGQPYGADWRQENEKILDVPDFVDESQREGYTAICEAILAIFSDKVYTVSVRHSPNESTHRIRPSRYNGLQKRIFFTDPLRTTGFEADENLPIFEVEWEPRTGATSLKCGTATGWLGLDAQSVFKTFTETSVLLKAAKMLKEVEDFRNILTGKSEDAVGGSKGGMNNACQTTIINSNNRKVTTVERDDRQKRTLIAHTASQVAALNVLNAGGGMSLPGKEITPKGYDAPGVKGTYPNSPVPRPFADARFPEVAPPAGRTNANLDTYGGVLGTDPQGVDGDAPDVLFKFPGGTMIPNGFALRKAADAYGVRATGQGWEWGQLGAGGSDPVTWAEFTGPESFPDALVPLATLTPGSTMHQVLQRTEALARALGSVSDSLAQITAPGVVTSKYPDGAPATLLDMLAAVGGNPWVRLVTSSINDAGGPVVRGPVTDDGVDAGTYWRLAMPERVLAMVTAVTPGTGLNGGAWAFDTSGPGGSLTYASSLYVTHKQAHASDLSPAQHIGDASQVTAAEGDDPFGTCDCAGYKIPSGVEAGVSTIFSLPVGARGTPVVGVSAREVRSEMNAALVDLDLELRVSFRASAWTPPASAGTGSAATTDGSGTGAGRFRAPGGSVPTGLRRPSDIAILAVTPPGGNAAGTQISGLEADVAVVEGGYWIRVHSQNVGAADSVSHTMPGVSDASSIGDDVSIEFTKVIEESVGIGDSVTVSLNPPVAVLDDVGIGDQAFVEIV